MNTPLEPVKKIVKDFLSSKKHGSKAQFPKSTIYEELKVYHGKNLLK